MSVDERDPHSGYKTTGHEWNGIKELNTPVPRPVYFFLIVTFLFSIGYWVLMPAWPIGNGYTHGTLNFSDRRNVAADVAQLELARAPNFARLEHANYQQISADPQLREFARAAGADRPAP